MQKQIQKIIESYAIKHGLTYNAIARESKVARHQLVAIKNGEIIPRIDTLIQILETCGKQITITDKVATDIKHSNEYLD